MLISSASPSNSVLLTLIYSPVSRFSRMGFSTVPVALNLTLIGVSTSPGLYILVIKLIVLILNSKPSVVS